MITSRKLKIWTIITHAFILVGFGHGIIFLGLIEVLWFPYFTKEHFSFSFSSSFESHLPIVGLTTLLGQIAMLLSVFNKKINLKIIFQLTSLIFLWLSILYFTYNANRDNYIHFATLSCIPFAVCTIITFLGKSIKRLYNWVLD